jgi:hypothetical protein
MVKAVTRMIKVVYMPIFWFGSLGRLDKSYNLHRHIEENSLHPTFLFVFVVVS